MKKFMNDVLNCETASQSSMKDSGIDYDNLDENDKPDGILNSTSISEATTLPDETLLGIASNQTDEEIEKLCDPMSALTWEEYDKAIQKYGVCATKYGFTFPTTCPKFTYPKPPKKSQGLGGYRKVANIFDSHCHLDRVFTKWLGYSQLEFYKGVMPRPLQCLRNVYSKLFDKFDGCINVITSPEYFVKECWDWLVEDPTLYLAIGCHPSNCMYYDEESAKHLEIALKHPKVVALGEIGLDDSWTKDSEVIFLKQQEVFRAQVRLALKAQKPMVFHIRGRNATLVAKEILDDENVPNTWPIHMHAFTDPYENCEYWAQKWPNMKFGVVSDNFDPELVRGLPLGKILLETDAPYFRPKVLDEIRSKRTGETTLHESLPGHVWFVANQVAYFKNVSVETVLKANRENVSELYNIPRWKPSNFPAFDGPEKKPTKIDNYSFTCSGRIDPKSGKGK